MRRRVRAIEPLILRISPSMISYVKIKWRNRLLACLPFISRWNECRHLFQSASHWRQEGWVTPPPYFIRRAMLLAEANAMGAKILVETGTFLGDTAWSFRNTFRQVYTIEVEPRLAELARDRFKNVPSVAALEGDSSAVLTQVCPKIDGSCVFFLDGHYSGGSTGMGEKECPVIEELEAIFHLMQHPYRIVIDDARLFGTDPAYPSIEALKNFLAKRNPSMQLRIENDAIILW
jgi:hypothetical protein